MQLRARNTSFGALLRSGAFSPNGTSIALHNYSVLVETDPTLRNYTLRPNTPMTSVWDCGYIVDDQVRSMQPCALDCASLCLTCPCLCESMCLCVERLPL